MQISTLFPKGDAAKVLARSSSVVFVASEPVVWSDMLLSSFFKMAIFAEVLTEFMLWAVEYSATLRLIRLRIMPITLFTTILPQGS